VRFLLDANALIHLLAGHDRFVRRASGCSAGDLCLSAISFAEVLHGSAAGKPPPTGLLARIRGRLPVLPFDEQAARVYADLPFKRHRFDRLIAAHALALDLILVTANRDDFHDIQRLKVEDWTL
jgi:tRNA(fMet)-specific endonuclease VapC